MAVLAVAPYVCFHRALQRNTSIVCGDGIVDLPYRILASRRLWSGEWPFWAPEILGGTDVWSYPVTAVLQPFTYLFSLLPPLLFLNIFTLGVYSLALTGAYIFARQWGLDRAGSAAAAISYSFSGFFFSYFSVAAHSMGHAAAFVPLLMASYLYLTKSPGPTRTALAALATFGMGITGQDQIALYGMVQAGYVIIIFLALNGSKGRKSILAWAVVAAVLGVGALSLRLIPSFEWLQESGRGVAVSTLMKVTHTAPPGKIIKTLFTPYSGEFPTQITYFGFFPLFLLVVGLGGFFRHRRIAWALGGCALALIDLYWSNFIPLDYYIKAPVLGWFHSPFRHMFELFLWASILSGEGLTAVVRERGISVLRMVVAVCSTAGCVVLSLWSLILSGGGQAAVFRERDISLISLIKAAFTTAGGDVMTNYGRWFVPTMVTGRFTSRGFLLLAVAVALIMAVGFVRGINAYMRWAGVVILFLMMLILNRHHFNNYMAINLARNGSANMQSEPHFLQFLKSRQSGDNRGAVSDRSVYIGNPYRISIEQRLESGGPNFGMFLGIPLVQAKSELLQKRYIGFIGEDNRVGCFMSPLVLSRRRTSLDLLNTRYILVPNLRDSAKSPKWPDLLKATLVTIEATQMPVLAPGEKIFLSWPDAPSSARLILLCSIYSDPSFGMKPALEIAIKDSNGLILNERLDEVKDIAHIIIQDSAKKRKMHSGLLFNGGMTYWSDIELSLPHGAGPFACTIESLLEQGTVAVVEAALVDSNDNVIERFPLINNYIDSQFHYPLIYTDNNVTVYERPTAFPRQWLVSSIMALPPQQILNELAKASPETGLAARLSETALVEDNSLSEFGAEMQKMTHDDKARIERLVDRPNFIVAKVTSKAPAFAIFSEAYANGWRAILDGKAVPIYRADYYLRGIAVPAGAHIIEMRYIPPGFIAGVVMSLFSFFIMFILAVLPARTEAHNV